MLAYLSKKAGILLISLFMVIFCTFFLMHAIPGDPFVEDRAIPEEILAALNKHYGLDRPLPIQFINYLKGLARFELGPSLKYEGRAVNQIISDGFPVSLCLGVESLVMAVFGGISLGSIASLNHMRWKDHLMMILTVLGISVPQLYLR